MILTPQNLLSKPEAAAAEEERQLLRTVLARVSAQDQKVREGGCAVVFSTSIDLVCNLYHKSLAKLSSLYGSDRL